MLPLTGAQCVEDKTEVLADCGRCRTHCLFGHNHSRASVRSSGDNTINHITGKKAASVSNRKPPFKINPWTWEAKAKTTNDAVTTKVTRETLPRLDGKKRFESTKSTKASTRTRAAQ